MMAGHVLASGSTRSWGGGLDLHGLTKSLRAGFTVVSFCLQLALLHKRICQVAPSLQIAKPGVPLVLLFC